MLDGTVLTPLGADHPDATNNRLADWCFSWSSAHPATNKQPPKQVQLVGPFNVRPNIFLVGGWPTPLKNDGVRQIRSSSQITLGENKTCLKPPTSFCSWLFCCNLCSQRQEESCYRPQLEVAWSSFPRGRWHQSYTWCYMYVQMQIHGGYMVCSCLPIYFHTLFLADLGSSLNHFEPIFTNQGQPSCTGLARMMPSYCLGMPRTRPLGI